MYMYVSERMESFAPFCVFPQLSPVLARRPAVGRDWHGTLIESLVEAGLATLLESGSRGKAFSEKIYTHEMWLCYYAPNVLDSVRATHLQLFFGGLARQILALLHDAVVVVALLERRRERLDLGRALFAQRQW